MTVKPDNGDIVAQERVPIGPDDTATEVFDKVTAAAAAALERVLPALIAGTAPRVVQDLSQGGYFGGRKPEDGRIDWSQPARRIHDLVRAVAPPYPGAFTDLGGHRLTVLRTRVVDDAAQHADGPRLRIAGGRLLAECTSGTLELVEFTLDGARVDLGELARLSGDLRLPSASAGAGAAA
jgi:methionyl-tRNA formyltransferase